MHNITITTYIPKKKITNLNTKPFDIDLGAIQLYFILCI